MTAEEQGASRNETDPEDVLVARARAGERAAFAALVERYYGFVFRVAWRLCGHRADAEDVAQEVCARLGRSIRGYRGGGAFTTWLYTLTLNAVRDLARRNAREVARAHALGAQATVEDQAIDDTESRAEALWAAVRRLPAKQRDVITLVYGEGLSHARAAEVLACAEATVSWHVHEAKKRLKTLARSNEDV